MRTDQPLSPDYVGALLESAGKTMMMLPPTGTRPRGHVSSWPEFLREWADLIEAPKENAKFRRRATMQEMNELAYVTEWLVDLANYCNSKGMGYVAKTIGYGMLRWPDTGRPRYSWRALARKFPSDPDHKTVKRWYQNGIEIITRRQNSIYFPEISFPVRPVKRGQFSNRKRQN